MLKVSKGAKGLLSCKGLLYKGVLFLQKRTYIIPKFIY